MKTPLWRILSFVAGSVVLLVGCGPKGARCRKCGMLVEQYPRWIAGLTNAEGRLERFCCERCMFAYWRSPLAPAAGMPG